HLLPWLRKRRHRHRPLERARAPRRGRLDRAPALFAGPIRRRSLVLAAVLVAGSLLAAEIGLRVAQLGAPIWHQADAQLGWRLRAHTQGFENGVFADINVAGQRDVDHRLDKPNGVYRIAVLGDEYSEALGLRLRHIWWWQLPGELQRCGFQSAKHIEVLNFGVAGYGTAQEYVMLESAAMRYQPDLVLLQFANRDDVADNSPALAAEKDRPFFVLDALGVARIADSFATSTSFEARSQFRYELLS